MNKEEIIEQTRLAFDFIQKLYFEVSYLIKEVEGLLAGEEERFVIGKPSGYGITARSSAGLETNNVNLWPLRKLAVFFVPEEKTQTRRGATITRLDENTKVIYLRIVLDEKDLPEPAVFCGVIYDIVKKSAPGKWPVKFENLIVQPEYNETRVFRDPERMHFEGSSVEYKGKLFRVNLFDINDSDQVMDRIVRPALEMFREIA